MEKVVKLYLVNNSKSSITACPFSDDLKNHLRAEFHHLTFIHHKLERLLEKSAIYHRIVCENITINYIPIPHITQKNMKILMKRYITTAHIFKIEKDIRFWIVPCMIHRIFPNTSEHFRDRNINGGYTYISNGIIYIYRYEEFAKVGLHELLHNSALQIHDFPPDDIRKMTHAFGLDATIPKSHFGNGDFQQLLPSEAVIEAWAIVLHLCFLSIEKDIAYDEVYERELEYAMSMTRKLLEYQERHHPVWRERTHAYCYIRLKTCILANWKTFYKFAYPYDAHAITAFLLKHNLDLCFIRRIRRAKLPTTNGCRITYHG